MRCHKNTFGFISLDAMAALALLGVLATSMLAVVSKNNAAALRLSESRRAVRIAEQVMLDLQTGQATHHSDAADVQLRTIDAPQVPSGMKWMCVMVRANRGSADLFGLVPASAPPTTGPATSSTQGAP